LREISARSVVAAAQILRAGVIVIALPEWIAKPKPKVASRAYSSAGSTVARCAAGSSRTTATTVTRSFTAPNQRNHAQRADTQKSK
jgi:hypothetical protein